MLDAEIETIYHNIPVSLATKNINPTNYSTCDEVKTVLVFDLFSGQGEEIVSGS